MFFKYDKFIVRMLDKNNKEELIESQKLRYEYLLREFNPALPEGGIDDDGFDGQADAIIVIDTEINKIVGTYRVETLKTTNGKKFIDEEEFNIDTIKNCGQEVLELGRAVVHKDYRTGLVIQLLWAGIFTYATENNCKYFFGTCSLHGTDPSVYKNLLCYLKKELQADVETYAVVNSYEFDFVDEYDEELLKEEMPSLLKSYIKMGARISRNGYIDRPFNCCDVLIIVDVDTGNRKFFERMMRFNRG